MKVHEARYARLFPFKNKKGNETKLRIIVAAVEFIADEGLEYLTFDAIGKRVGMNAAQIRYHFMEKSELIARCIDFVLISYQESLIAKLENVTKWEQQLKMIVNGTFDWVRDHPEQKAVLLVFFYLASSNPRYQKLHKKMYDNGIQRMKELLRETNPKWSDAKRTEMAHAVWAIIDGHLLYCLTTKLSPDHEFYRKLALKGIRSFLHAKGDE